MGAGEMTDGNPEVRACLEAGDVRALQALVELQPMKARALVRWGEGGKNTVPPLHFVCDCVFRGMIDQATARALADVLLTAGVDPSEAYARSGDTFLIAAASLGAEDVGLRLLEAGVDVSARGLFGATALHWAALMGCPRLVAGLVEAGAELELLDDQYHCTPLQWTYHAWKTDDGAAGFRPPRALAATARVFAQAGARVPHDPTLSRPKDAALLDAVAAKN